MLVTWILYYWAIFPLNDFCLKEYFLVSCLHSFNAILLELCSQQDFWNVLYTGSVNCNVILFQVFPSMANRMKLSQTWQSKLVRRKKTGSKKKKTVSNTSQRCEGIRDYAMWVESLGIPRFYILLLIRYMAISTLYFCNLMTVCWRFFMTV